MQETLLQYFEWYLPPDGGHWRRAAADAPHLASLGFTGVWLPPAYKGHQGQADVGYGVYDLYALGEFDQKGTVPTKYGLRDEYLSAICALHAAGIQVYADIVLNHRMGADECEEVIARQSSGGDRNCDASSTAPITAWTKFTFPGRGGTYSKFQWDWTCFDGVDWDDQRDVSAIYKFQGKDWDRQVDCENGNYDYLMGADLDMGSPKVIEELDRWGKWYLETTGVDGFRLDAVKHIRASYFTHWLQILRRESGKPLPAIGEYWHQNTQVLTSYLDQCGQVMRLFDVPLHFQFHNLSGADGAMDLRHLFQGTLTGSRPDQAVTFVDNHDTQPGQALQSWVAEWCKPLAYACILLRQEGVPCVFYGDLYGIPHDRIGPVKELPKLLLARKYCACGQQIDYLDNPDTIGWVRQGQDCAMAVVLTDGPAGSKQMCVGAGMAETIFVDLLGGREEQILIPENGMADFPVNGGSVSVWLPQDMARLISLALHRRQSSTTI